MIPPTGVIGANCDGLEDAQEADKASRNTPTYLLIS